ncbi:MAG: hypothetical protein ACJ8M4_00820 [Chthoniobacterales bacterium]
MNFPGSTRLALLVGLVIALTGHLSASNLTCAGRLRIAASSSLDPILLTAIVILGVGFAGFLLYKDSVRTANMETYARSLGVPFRRSPTTSDEHLPIGCSLEQTGYDHIIANVLEAVRTEDLVLTLFDYKYTPDSNALVFAADLLASRISTTQTYEQTIARIQSPLLKLPSFNLVPETIFKTVGKMFGGSDIDFPEAPGFNDQYILRGGNEAALRAIFTPALRRFLQPLQHLTIEGADDVLFVYRWQRRSKDVGPLVEENKRILALFLEGQLSIRPAV